MLNGGGIFEFAREETVRPLQLFHIVVGWLARAGDSWVTSSG